MRPLGEEELAAARMRLNEPRQKEEPPGVETSAKKRKAEPMQETQAETGEVIAVSEFLHRVDGRGADTGLDVGS